MSEQISMTSISDLPSNPQTSGNIQIQIQDTIPQSHGQPFSLDQATISQIVNGIQTASASGATRLPSRDIPMTKDHLTSDQQAMPNYVPKNTNRYIDEDYDEFNDTPNYSNNLNENIYNELRFPLLLGILYFIFQMPFFKNFLFQHCLFMFSSDGNYNINGLTIIAIIFSFTFYLLTNVVFKKM